MKKNNDTKNTKDSGSRFLRLYPVCRKRSPARFTNRVGIQDSRKGFTLIEVMVSVTLFVIIVVAGIGAVLNANNIHKKTQIMRAAIDNLSFLMEDMSRNIRLGSEYHCGNSVLGPKNCLSDDGLLAVTFRNTNDKIWVYSIEDLNNGKVGVKKSKDGGNNYLVITAPEVEINSELSGFTVFGADENDGQQPRVLIRMAGVVNYRNLHTNFNLETTVSQRLIE